MESAQFKEFQNIDSVKQKYQVVKSEDSQQSDNSLSFYETENEKTLLKSSEDKISVEDTMYSDSKVEKSSQTKDCISPKLKEIIDKQVENCSNEDYDSEDEFQIKQFRSKEELQTSMKEKGIRNFEDYLSTPPFGKDKKEKEETVTSWVQCDIPICQKWRKVVGDVSGLSNGKWDCSMNTDKYRNNCDCSQEVYTEGSEDESIYTSFKPGVIVLGKMVGYPWWPAIIEDDPDFNSFFYLDRKPERVIVSYHVTFFGQNVSRAWLTECNVREFDGNESKEELGQLSYQQTNYSKQVMAALQDAKKAIKLSLGRRVNTYGFLRRYKGKRKSKDTGRSPKKNVLKSIENRHSEKRKKHIVKEIKEDAYTFDHVDASSDDDVQIIEDIPGNQMAHKIKKKMSSDNYLERSRLERKKMRRKERKRLLKENKKLKKANMHDILGDEDHVVPSEKLDNLRDGKEPSEKPKIIKDNKKEANTFKTAEIDKNENSKNEKNKAIVVNKNEIKKKIFEVKTKPELPDDKITYKNTYTSHVKENSSNVDYSKCKNKPSKSALKSALNFKESDTESLDNCSTESKEESYRENTNLLKNNDITSPKLSKPVISALKKSMVPTFSSKPRKPVVPLFSVSSKKKSFKHPLAVGKQRKSEPPEKK